jgi:hypothetical protein
VPCDLVGGERPEHDGELRTSIASRQDLPDTRHQSH